MKQDNSLNFEFSWLKRLSHLFKRRPQDKLELVYLLSEAKNRELIDLEALSMITGVLKISEMQARDVMIPRAQMVVIEQDADIQTVLKTVTQAGHSRFPVIGESRNEVLGILLAKDLLQHHEKINTLIRTAIIVPESKRLDLLLKDFRLKHNHIAIVVDEYGGVAGLITIEEILEQIVGSIEDEYDVDNSQDNIVITGSNEYTVKALTPINEFNDAFQTNIDNEHWDTIGGYLTSRFGHIPKRGEQIETNGLTITVTKTDKRRTLLLRVSKQNNATLS